MNKYKTFEELKEELGDKFEEYMYKANIELLTKIDKENQKYKEVIDKANNWVRNYMDEWSINDEVWQELNELLILLEEVE